MTTCGMARQALSGLLLQARWSQTHGCGEIKLCRSCRHAQRLATFQHGAGWGMAFGGATSCTRPPTVTAAGRTWCAASMCRSSSVLAGTRLGTEMSSVTGRPLLRAGTMQQVEGVSTGQPVVQRQPAAHRNTCCKLQRSHPQASATLHHQVLVHTTPRTCTWWQTGAAQRRGAGRRRRQETCRS